jgi:hypothetical protein
MEYNQNKVSSKIYLGNCQERSRVNGDKYLTGSICLDDIASVPEEHIQKGKNGKRYLQIIVNPYISGANAYGNTHSVAVNTFKGQSKSSVDENGEKNFNITEQELTKNIDGNGMYDNEFFKE